MGLELYVYIEQNGKNRYVGILSGRNYQDVEFQYDKEYLEEPSARAISVSMPLQEKAFSPEQTRCFFNGLLPEGYTRRCVAAEINAKDDDYIAILHNLGRECLGAIQILSSKDSVMESRYEVMSDQQLKAFAREGASESAALVTKAHLSLTGASGKAGLYCNEEDQKWYLPHGCAPSTHIVKQSHVRLTKIVTNEQFCLLTARKLGIEIPESFIVPFQDDENVLFATKRYDRTFIEKCCINGQGLLVPVRLHQEDFAQVLGIQSERKYERAGEHYLKRMFQLLRSRASNPMQDQMALWRIVVFNYLIGNTDNHIKNSSILYDETLESFRLAPAYDIISTIIYEQSTEEMALSIHDKYNIYEITREDFAKEAKTDGLNVRLFMREFDRMQQKLEGALRQTRQELIKQGFYESEDVYEKILNKCKQRKLIG